MHEHIQLFSEDYITIQRKKSQVHSFGNKKSQNSDKEVILTNN